MVLSFILIQNRQYVHPASVSGMRGGEVLMGGMQRQDAAGQVVCAIQCR